jgi:hypothetical protein
LCGLELAARIRAALRRSRMIAAEPAVPRGRHLRFAGWVLDLARRELTAPDGSAADLAAADRLGHRIEVRSIAGRGSCFTVVAEAASMPAAFCL